METTTENLSLLSSLPQGQNTPNTPFLVNEWDINSFPPEITQVGGYSQSPTTPVQVSTGTANAIPMSKVTPNDKQNVYYGYVGINSDPSCLLGNDGEAYWQVKGRRTTVGNGSFTNVIKYKYNPRYACNARNKPKY